MTTKTKTKETPLRRYHRTTLAVGHALADFLKASDIGLLKIPAKDRKAVERGRRDLVELINAMKNYYDATLFPALRPVPAWDPRKTKRRLLALLAKIEKRYGKVKS